MRTIKLRGRRINRDGEWAYGDLHHLPGCTLIVPSDGFPAAIDRDKVDPETIGQFTGSYDKNGKEIYEGDIVHLDTWKPDAMLISFIEGAFCLTDVNENYLGDIHYIIHAGIEQCTVIGNIHDNPELLEGGENKN